MNNKPFAEVIESSLIGWLAQSWQWDSFPAFGSLVMVRDKQQTTLGIVHQIQTGSMDPVRYPFPYKKTEEELRKEQPQIFEFLKTTFSCLTIGYEDQGKIYYQLPPTPSKIHAFVTDAPPELSKRFFGHELYMHVLFGLSHTIQNMDELLLALLQYQAQLGILHEKKLIEFIEIFSLLTGNDYRRIKLFLQRAEPIIHRSMPKREYYEAQ